MTLYSAKHLRIMLTISGKCLDDWVNTRLNLNQRSADFFKREVDYLEQVVSAAGYRLDHSNVEAIRTLKKSKPSTVSEVRRLLGLLGHYHRYIQDFARIAQHVFQLLQAAFKDGAKSAYKAKERFNHGLVPSSRPME